MRHRWFDRWTLLTLLGVGAFMFWGAGHYTVFDDEGFSCRRYSMPLGEMVSALWHGAEPDPPLYYILQNIWVHLFGVGPLGLRSLSIVMFLVGLVFIRLAGMEWYDDQTGRLAMLIAALHPAHLLFGFAGRWYSTMFCVVAILFWLTGLLAKQAKARRGMVIAWSFAAAAVCYTNYFGPVVVGILWLAMIVRFPNWLRWVQAATGTLLLFSVWFPAFWSQATRFPQFAFSWSKYGDTALRLMMAFSTGNLASVSTWWIWLPVLVCVISCMFLVKTKTMKQMRPHSLGYVVAGCFLAGIASRTIIDKYIMTFSGLACILMASVWLRNRRHEKAYGAVLATWFAALSLGFAWLGCYVHLITERHWSSLRWLDPYEATLSELVAGSTSPPPTDWVMSQPAARYYYGCMMARRVEPNGAIRPDVWRRFADLPGESACSASEAAATPESMLDRMKSSKPPRIATIRGAEFTDSPEWKRLQKILDAEYRVVTERTYLNDPDAKWKDKLDPTFKHPEWRITVRIYELGR